MNGNATQIYMNFNTVVDILQISHEPLSTHSLFWSLTFIPFSPTCIHVLFLGGKIRKKSLITKSTWQYAQKKQIFAAIIVLSNFNAAVYASWHSQLLLLLNSVTTMQIEWNKWMKNDKWKSMGETPRNMLHCDAKIINFSMKRTKFSKKITKIM